MCLARCGRLKVAIKPVLDMVDRDCRSSKVNAWVKFQQSPAANSNQKVSAGDSIGKSQ